MPWRHHTFFASLSNISQYHTTTPHCVSEWTFSSSTLEIGLLSHLGHSHGNRLSNNISVYTPGSQIRSESPSNIFKFHGTSLTKNTMFRTHHTAIRWVRFPRGAPEQTKKKYTHKNSFNTLRPRQMAAIFQTTFSNAFSWMKMY